MQVFTAEEVDVTFEQQAIGRVSVEYPWERFLGYDDFERYQLEERKPVWMDALMIMSGCRKWSDLELQWDLFGQIFRKFHADHLDWLIHPEICPPDIFRAREAELAAVLDLFVEQRKCHWKRGHEFVCFCN